MLPEHSVISLPWTNMVAVRVYWNTDLFLSIVLLNYGTFQFCSCCHIFLHKPGWFLALQWHPKFYVCHYLTMVAESCDILSIVLPYFSLWSYTWLEDLPSNRHRQYCMRNRGFGSAGGVRRDATSLCMPPHTTLGLFMWLCCASLYWYCSFGSLYSPPSLVTPVINCGFLHPVCLLKAAAWCI